MNRRISLAVVSLLMAISIHAPPAWADTLVIVGDRWCPFNCEAGQDHPGYLVEVAQRSLAKAGHTVEYQIVPWTRAVQESRRGAFAGIIGAAVDDAPDFIFPQEEQGIVSDGVFVLKEKNWTYTDTKSLAGIVIGVVKGYSYNADELNAYIEKYSGDPDKVRVTTGDEAATTNVRNLALARLDAVVESPEVFWYAAAQLHLQDKFKSAGTVGAPKKVFIAFSPANPKSKEYAKALVDGVNALRKSGELKVILAKYGIEDWKKLATGAGRKK